MLQRCYPLALNDSTHHFTICLMLHSDCVLECCETHFSRKNTRQRHRDHILFRLYVTHQIKIEPFARHFSLNSFSFVVK